MKKTWVITTALLFCGTNVCFGQTIGNMGNKQVTAIEPKKKVTKVNSAKIDTERFEVGVYGGFLSIEDFDSNALVGIDGSYHINAHFLVNIAYAKSDGARASFEEQEGGDFIQDRDEGFTYLSVGGSYNLFKGRSFIGAKRKYDSYLSIDGALENVTFAGESNIGFALGATYKTVLTDWLTSNLRFKNHIVQREFLGTSQLTQNLELSLGFNVLF